PTRARPPGPPSPPPRAAPSSLSLRQTAGPPPERWGRSATFRRRGFAPRSPRLRIRISAPTAPESSLQEEHPLLVAGREPEQRAVRHRVGQDERPDVLPPVQPQVVDDARRSRHRPLPLRVRKGEPSNRHQKAAPREGPDRDLP